MPCAVECLIAGRAKLVNSASRVKKMRRGHIDGDRHVTPGSKPQASMASTTISNACSLLRSRGP